MIYYIYKVNKISYNNLSKLNQFYNLLPKPKNDNKNFKVQIQLLYFLLLFQVNGGIFKLLGVNLLYFSGIREPLYGTF